MNSDPTHIDNWPAGTWCLHDYEVGVIEENDGYKSFRTPHFSFGTKGPIYPLTLRNLAIANEVEFHEREIRTAEKRLRGGKPLNWPRVKDRLNEFFAEACKVPVEDDASVGKIYGELMAFSRETISAMESLKSTVIAGCEVFA